MRAVRPADAARLHALSERPALAAGSVTAPYQPLKVTEGFIEKLTLPQALIVACIGDTLIGSAELWPGKIRRAHTGSVGVSVHEAWQRRGIGRALMDAVIDIADNWLGLRRLELEVFTDNQPALALYRALGFEIEARHRGAVLTGGLLVDSYLMARLREAAPFANE